MTKKPIDENLLRAMRGAARGVQAMRAARAAKNAQVAAEEEGERRYVGRLARNVKQKVDQRNATNQALADGSIKKRPRLPWKKGGFRGMMNDIIKGHPGYMKAESTQIDEMSPGKVRNYIGKAKKHAVDLYKDVMDAKDPANQEKKTDKMMKRSSMIGKARNRYGIKHWEESFEARLYESAPISMLLREQRLMREISSGMYGRYIEKAKVDVDNKSKEFVGKHTWDKKLLRKLSKRSGEIGRADNRKEAIDKGEMKYWLHQRKR